MKRKFTLCAAVFTIVLTQYLASTREQSTTKTIEVAEQNAAETNILQPRTLID